MTKHWPLQSWMFTEMIWEHFTACIFREELNIYKDTDPLVRILKV